jgi:phosphatidate phosphatase APP1
MIARFKTGAVARMAVAAIVVPFLFSRCAAIAGEGPVRGEEVQFFQSLASVSSDNRWLLTIQGRIFEPAEKSQGREAMIDTLAPMVGASHTDTLFRARAGCFLSDSNRNTRVSVKVGERVIPLSASDPAGYFTADITLTNSEVMQLAKGGMISFQSLPTVTNTERFPGSVILVPEEGVTVITDMDDTIKITDMLNHRKKMANTFVLPFRAVPGMADLYRSWKEALGPSIHFHVVSAGPWQLNEPLRRFTEEAGFPAFTWDMRSVDIGDVSVLLRELRSNPKEFKLAKIQAFMARFPKRHVVLVGDSGEQDPEVYSAILAEFPDRVDAVFIRNVRSEDQKDRYKRLFPSKEATAKLQVFLDPKKLPHLTPPS